MSDVYQSKSRYTRVEITADNMAQYNMSDMVIGFIGWVNNASGMMDALLSPEESESQFEMISE